MPDQSSPARSGATQGLTTRDIQQFLDQNQPIWHLLAVAYTLGGYLGGIALLLAHSAWLNALGVLLLTHSLILSAYLAHDLMHGSIFATSKQNARLGNLMLWLNGSCYARFQDLAKWHMAHHVNRVDFCRFDLVTALNELPTPLRSLLLALEWLYIPALAFWSRLRALLAPFREAERRDERSRVALILAIRVGLLMILGSVSLKALLLYWVAYIGMITGLRFMDCFQHTYEVFPIGAPLPNRDRAHEQANTYSNVVSLRYGWLNLLLLNFGYHNAHHELMKCPWHRLPALDRHLFVGNEVQYVTLPRLLWNYHRFRVHRIFSGQGEIMDAQGKASLDQFYGAIEVSFLVLPA
jgi:fatty acid desaturase